MTSDALNRALRQIALPQIGLDGQQRIAASTVTIVGDDLACEVAARALAAAGVGRLRWVRRAAALPGGVGEALVASNPDLVMGVQPWPETGSAWVAALDGSSVVLRSGFDDDPMMRAAIRLGIPAVVMRGRDDGVDVVSFRRQGPCPHAPLDVPARTGAPPQNGAGAVVGAHLAAAEALVVIAGATSGKGRARHIRIPFGGAPAPDGAGGAADQSTRATRAARATDIPWTPECFACGGTGSEMSFT